MAIKKNPLTDTPKVDVEDTFIKAKTHRGERVKTTISLHPKVKLYAKRYVLSKDGMSLSDLVEDSILTSMGVSLQEVLDMDLDTP